MTIQHTSDERGGRFFVPGPDGDLAEMTYKRQGQGTIYIEHTEVSDALKGKNVGNSLMEAAVEFARAEGIKIVPLCVFAAAVFRKRPELGDVLRQEMP